MEGFHLHRGLVLSGEVALDKVAVPNEIRTSLSLSETRPRGVGEGHTKHPNSVQTRYPAR